MYFVAKSYIIQILIPYLLGFLGIYCRNPHLPLNGNSSMQTAEPTKYYDLHKPMNLSQNFSKCCHFIFQTTLSSCFFVVKSWNWQEKPERFFTMTTGKTNLPAPSILYSDSLCSCEDSKHSSINQEANDSTKFIQLCSPHSFMKLASEVEEITINFSIGGYKYNVQNIIRNKKWKSIMWGICIFGFIHTPGKTHNYILSACSSNVGRCPAPGKALALKNIRLLVCVVSCFWMLNICVFRLSMVTSVSFIVHRVNIIIKIFLYSFFFIFWALNHLV